MIATYKPQEGPQTIFHTRLEDIVGYGGTKGPGKTEALLGEAMRQIDHPEYRGLLLRRTFPQLQEIIDRGRVIYGRVGAVWLEQKHKFVFPSGAQIFVGHAQHETDVENYQGHEYQFIGIDQAEQWTKNMVFFMIAQNRTSKEGLRCYVRLTFNPGGIGTGWIRDMFIRGKVPGQTYTETYNLADGRTLTRTTCFIRGTVHDNKILMATNPQYLANLMSQPEKYRKAWLEGDFDALSGQFFSEFYESTHVIAPFTIPLDYKIYISLDWGYTAPLSCHWWAVDPGMKHVYCIAEYYVTQKNSPEAAKEIHEKNRKMFGEEYISQRRIEEMYVDPSIFANKGNGGKTIGEDFFDALWEEAGGRKLHLPIVPADNSRVAGWNVFRNMLVIQADGKPFCMWFKNCTNAVRTIPEQVHDDTHPEDLDTDGEDHAADDHRYFFISRFVGGKEPVADPYPKLKDPASRREWELVAEQRKPKTTNNFMKQSMRMG